MRYLLGIDVGTTGTKTILIDESGNLAASAYKGYPVINKGNSLVEQDALLWWDAVINTVRRCTSCIDGDISGISLSSQGATTVCADREGNALSDAIVWMDTRGSYIAEKINKLYGESFFYRKTGWRLSNCFNFLTVKWLKENDKELFERTYKFLSTSDYIYHKLCGVFATDESSACITQLYNIIDRKWDHEILELCGISEDRLSEVKRHGSFIGELKREAAEELGLKEGIPVFSGAHDQYAATVGNNAIEPGDAMLSCGTSWGLMAITDKPVFDNNVFFSAGRHVIDGFFSIFSYTPSGGSAFEWIHRNIASIVDGALESFKSIDENASVIPAGSEGLRFYPYFAGTSCPTWSPNNKTSIIGLSFHHTRYHIAKACMEGVVFEINWMLEALRNNHMNVTKLKALGGGSKSRIWMQIAADITGLPVICPQLADVPAVGAAMIAGVASGVFENYKDAFMRIHKGANILIEPDMNTNNIYKVLFKQYKKDFYELRVIYESPYNFS